MWVLTTAGIILTYNYLGSCPGISVTVTRAIVVRPFDATRPGAGGSVFNPPNHTHFDGPLMLCEPFVIEFGLGCSVGGY